MSTFKFAIFYMHNKTVKVENTSIIVDPNFNFVQIYSQPNLEDDNWIEIKCATRKQPDKTEAAKVLLFGDSFTELIQKKNLFLLGKDIWPNDAVSAGHETTNASQKTKKKLTASARSQVLRKLKESLSQKTAHSEELFSSSSENGTPIRKVYKPKKRAIQFSPEQSSDETDIGSVHPENDDQELAQLAKDVKEHHAQLVQKASAPRMAEIVESLRELPETVRQLKECIMSLNQVLQSHTVPSASPVTSPASDSEVEMHFLPGNTVAVSKRAYQRLNRSRMSIFAQELAVLVFSKDTLAQSTLTGKSGKTGTPKNQLDVNKVQAIIDAVINQFPETRVSEIRAVLRRKCNNEQFSQKRFSCQNF